MAVLALVAVATWAVLFFSSSPALAQQAKKIAIKPNVTAIHKALDRQKPAAACKGPRPKARGCKQVCKPCFVSYCENGQWVSEPLDWPEGQCAPRTPPGGGICTRVSGFSCGAGCKVCINL
jgi:hypothetical protein